IPFKSSDRLAARGIAAACHSEADQFGQEVVPAERALTFDAIRPRTLKHLEGRCRITSGERGQAAAPRSIVERVADGPCGQWLVERRSKPMDRVDVAAVRGDQRS